MTTISRTIREQITDRIRDEPISGRMPTGSRCAKGAGRTIRVSRGPVRDAFLQLTNEGFLAYQANCGVTVRTAMVGADRDFLMSLRWQIEEFVIRRGFSQMTDDHQEKMDAALDRLRVACRQKDVAAIARCDMEFHQTILIATGGEEFLPIWKQLCTQMLLAYSRFNNYSQIIQEHVAICEAFRKKRLKSALRSERQFDMSLSHFSDAFTNLPGESFRHDSSRPP